MSGPVAEHDGHEGRDGHGGFVAVAAEDELWDGEMDSYRVGGVEVLLVRLGGQYHAYHGVCPHQSSSLVDGDLDGGTLTCWAHQWTFDAVTGTGINPRTACLTRYAVRVAGGQVWVSREPVVSTAATPARRHPSLTAGA